MIKEALKHATKYEDNILVLDDCSEYDITPLAKYARIYRAPYNRGKKEYYKQWQKALAYARLAKEEDYFIFSVDDFKETQYQELRQIYEALNDELNGAPFAVNIIYDGRLKCFSAYDPTECKVNGLDFWRVGFVDCGFICNRKALEVLNFTIEPIPPIRWLNNEAMSSGVGQQITNKFARHGVKMYIPKASLASHGSHPSKMNPEERIKNPLISK